MRGNCVVRYDLTAGYASHSATRNDIGKEVRSEARYTPAKIRERKLPLNTHDHAAASPPLQGEVREAPAAPPSCR
ncbi:hypothetical protein E2C01_085932 [Portunus trituberculatus]|uniref:Uncharacterized protein n=1 Tax=Portunus trituberculatus TaxID=210409 RepID=A0A5B7JD93_PORTR|nr:hypothetical protein [Portunus trituberculatus]